MKRTVLCLVAVCCLATVFAGCAQKKTEGDAKIVQFGTTKADLFGLPAEYRSIHSRLETIFGGPIMFRSQPSGSAIGEQLNEGLIEYALMSAGEYAAVEDTRQITPIASALNSAGRTSRKAYIVIRANSHLHGIEDCKAKRFGFGAYGDLLTDRAARAALEKAGVPVKDLLPELLTPPPLGLEGRLYLNNDVAKTIVNDPTVNAGVVDELVYDGLRDTGGSFLLGPSKDQLTIVGETVEVPEMVVVAGPAADPAMTAKLKDYLINQAKSDDRVCKDLGIKGFAEPSKAAFEPIRAIAAMK